MIGDLTSIVRNPGTPIADWVFAGFLWPAVV
jgi:hypothetical protein